MNPDAIKVFHDFGIVEMNYSAEPIEVSSYSGEPDPNWKFTDAQGHHHWRSKKEDNHYPTLIWVVDSEGGDPDDWGGEYPPTGHYECAACGEVIEPGSVPPSYCRKYIQGMQRFSIKFSDGQIITLNGDQIDDIKLLSEAKYDYQFTKLRRYFMNLKENQKVKV